MEPPAPEHRYFLPRDERTVLDFVIEDFPFPLAITYARLQQEMDRQEPVAAAWRLRDAFEVLVKFSASLAVADALTAPVDPAVAGQLAGTLLTPQGLSLGHWCSLLDTALEPLKPFAGDGRLGESGRAIPELFAVFNETTGRMRQTAVRRGILGSGDTFVAWRNRVFGHGVFQEDRGWYADETVRWLEPLHRFYDALRPVLDRWNLVGVLPEGGEVAWRGAEDSPLVARHEHQPFGELVPMLLVPREAGASPRLPLTPLLSVQRCAVCGEPAAFFFDRRKNKRTILLEYARGHQHTHPAWAEVERLVALVPPTFVFTRESYDSQEIAEGDAIAFRNFEQEYLRPDYLADIVWRVVSDRPSGYLHLVGPAGTGKTYFIRGLESEASAQGAVVLSYFIRPGALSDGMTFLNELHLVASERLRIRTPAPQVLVASHAALREQFVSYLRELKISNGLETLIVAIDALDELPDPEPAAAAITDLLPDPGALPDGCYVALTSRERVRPGILKGLDRLAGESLSRLLLDPGARANLDLVRTFLAANLPEPFQAPAHIETALERSGGIFLYAFHFAHALASGVFSDTTTLPEADQFYPAYLTRIRDRVGETIFQQAYLLPLILLTAARRPVTRDQLVRWGASGDRLAMALFDLRDFLRVRRGPSWHDSLVDDGEARYELAHEAFARFVHNDPDLSKRLRAAHETIAQTSINAFGDRWETADPYDAADLYNLCEMPAHLAEAGLDPSLDANLNYAGACRRAGKTAYGISRFEIAERLHAQSGWVLRLLVASGRADLANDLAKALVNRGIALRELGRLPQAVTAYDEAIEIRRPLVDGGQTDLANALARTLMNQGVALRQIGELERAVAAYDEAIGIRRSLVQGGQADLANELAAALMNQGIALRGLGQSGEAVAAYDESIEIRRSLVESGQADVSRALAKTQMNRGIALRGFGQLAEAVTAYDEAIDRYRQLVEGGRTDLANSLARTLMNRGVALRDLGELERAVTAYDEAIGIRRPLVEAGRTELSNGLAMTLANKAMACEQQGEVDLALECYGEAIQLREQRVASGMAHLVPSLVRTVRQRMTTLIELHRWDAVAADAIRILDHVQPVVGGGEAPDAVVAERDALITTLRDLAPEDRETVLTRLGPWENQVRQWLAGQG
jgi:tetratricopeptide (TPR) repeat protein